SHVATLGRDGLVRVARVGDGRVVLARPLLTPPVRLTAAAVPSEGRLFAAATADGRVALAPVEFEVAFAGDRRVVTPRFGAAVVLELDPGRRPLRAVAAQLDAEGNAAAAAVLAGGALALVRRTAEENLLSGEVTESLQRFALATPHEVTSLALDPDQRNLYAGTRGGELLRWELGEAPPRPARAVSAGRVPVTAVALLIGGRSLVVGRRDGALAVWLSVPGGEEVRLTRVREFPRQGAAIVDIAPSLRDKGFLALDAGGGLGLYHSTAHRTLWRGRSPVAGAEAVAFAPKADAAYVAAGGRVAALDLRNPHPEVTWKALFGKVWYEGYERPERVWQSSGGTDDFEPKLSLTPLLVGTLKGTFYSLLLAIPLGVLGAMYTSQFMHPSYKRVLKPLIEIMAALPSVVLGFLAGLWLAPRVERAVPGLLLMLVVLPAAVLLAGAAWWRLPRRFRNRFHVGVEAILFVFVLAGAIWLCLALSAPFERLAFGGSFPAWLLETFGLPYDQRNAVVVGLAMGFAVIPIIFAIAEDAFSNVPPNLVAGSLALGADRWQTVTRVVLPTASPGLFSAVMVGFGRAVGETMIVLMATGNTPIMSWNPFNGFRTLSANIAVEIPEAPHGGTLYRTLFLAALLLFGLTFLVNTVAELVRQRLRERYAQL
ncbi:MAG TPA: ABC transporter permease subunit, partial [Thermoanaerobaculia bacterium]|nr:ABC transporter permease subunit [Thermoanaerobaculia bacterium]